MLYKTRAIALYNLKYTDNSIISNVYTEKFGKQTFLLKGVYGKKSPIKANLFAPLNLLELEVYHKTNRELHKLKEAVNSPVFQTIHSDPIKNTMSFFIAEVLHKVLQEEVQNEALFDYCFNSLQILDFENTSNIANFHFIFLFGLSKYVGFYPANNFSGKESIFDLINGRFVDFLPDHGHYLPQEISAIWSKLMDSSFESSPEVLVSRESRLLLLEKMIEYFHLHIPGMGNIKSLNVLKEIYT